MRENIVKSKSIFALLSCLSVIVFLGFSNSQLAYGQLSDAGFDSPFTTADFVAYGGTGATAVDRWAAEDGTVVGADNGVSPIDGDQMVRMGNNGGSASTELKQRVGSIGLFTDAQVDAGQVVARFFACFNAPANAPAGMSADILLQFLDGSLNAIGAPISLNSGPMDNDPSTWEHVEISNVAVPALARGAEAIIRHNNASLTGPQGFVAGYVDKTHLGFSAIPEPSSLLLALCGLSLMLRRRASRV